MCIKCKDDNHCIYCHNNGFYGDEFTGGENYCDCKIGRDLQEFEQQRLTVLQILQVPPLTASCKK